MKLVERYIFLRALKVSAATLVIVLAIAWTTQVLGRINFITNSGQTIRTFFELATLLLPTVIPVVAPFAVIIGATQALSTMSQDSEMSVIAASGASRGTIIKPIMLLGIIVAALSFFVANVVEPAARARVRHIIATAHADLLSTVIEEGNFRKVEDGLYVQVAERLPDGRLGGVIVADSRQENVDLIFYAKEGDVVRLDTRYLLFMRDGEVHRKTPNGDVSVIRFASYAFDLSEFSASANGVTLYPKDRTLSYLLDPDPNDEMLKYDPRSYTAEIHRRLSEWTFGIIFALYALAAAGDARSHRQARIHPMVAAVSCALAARWQGYVVGDRVEDSTAWVPVVYAVLAFNVLFPLYFIVSGRTLEPPAAWSEAAGRALQRLQGLAGTLRRRIAPRTVEGRP